MASRTVKGSNSTTRAANEKIRAAAKKGAAPTPADVDAEALPEGFEEVMGARVRGWFDRQAGNTLTGRLLEVFQTKSRFALSGKKNVYKIEVTKGTCGILVAGPGEDDEPTSETAAVGDVVGLDESGWLKRLASVEPGREVYVKCLGKSAATEDAPNGAWMYRVGVNTTERVDLKSGEVHQTAGRAAGDVGRDL